METKIIVTYLNAETTAYDSVNHYSDDGEFLTITSKYEFPKEYKTSIAKINLRNIRAYTIMISESKEETNNG